MEQSENVSYRQSVSPTCVRFDLLISKVKTKLCIRKIRWVFKYRLTYLTTSDDQKVFFSKYIKALSVRIITGPLQVDFIFSISF